MQKFLSSFVFLSLLVQATVAQPLAQKITDAVQTFESHESLANGMASFIVLNANSGEVVSAKHEHLGLAPASTLKPVTSSAAHQVLGADYTSETTLSYT